VRDVADSRWVTSSAWYRRQRQRHEVYGGSSKIGLPKI